MIKIEDWQDKYTKQIDEMEYAQWGDWGSSIKEYVSKKAIIRVALYNDNFAGVAYGQLIKDFFWVNVICILPQYQKMDIGTMLMNDIMDQAIIKFGVSKFEAESVLVNGKSNSKKLIENSGFVLKCQEKGFWGKKHPEVFCTECNKKPCECNALFYVKQI